MKSNLLHYISVNKKILTKIAIAIASILILGFVLKILLSKPTKPKYDNLIKSIEKQQEQDKKDLLDSISVRDKVNIKLQKEIADLTARNKSQDVEIQTIKRMYEIKRNNINSMDADELIRTSAKQLSK